MPEHLSTRVRPGRLVRAFVRRLRATILTIQIDGRTSDQWRRSGATS